MLNKRLKCGFKIYRYIPVSFKIISGILAKRLVNCNTSTMPELPEVETIRSGLNPILSGQRVRQAVIRRFDLRFPLSPDFPQKIQGLTISSVARRAKYLLFHFDGLSDTALIWHLGMSGSLRLVKKKLALKKHDHIDIEIADYYLRYNDPRRFGFLLWSESITSEPCLLRLGPEPLSENFTGQYLQQVLRNKRTLIKKIIMDNKIVVGVGNIYANEALYLAKIHPEKVSSSLTKKQCDVLVKSIKSILRKAIKAGGTTLKDFRDSQGNPGYFQQQLFVYGKKNDPCLCCGEIIKSCVIAQRSAFYCPYCQK